MLPILLPSILACLPPPRVYVASFEYESSAAGGDQGGVQTFQPSASQIMRSPKTVVAFYPPDACLNTSAVPANAKKSAEYLQMSCGVLMTELETQAGSAGYDVVSWQMLRHGAPLDQARELGVDVLFEVNELSVVGTSNSTVAVTSMEFYEQESLDERSPLVLSSVAKVGERCNERYGQSAAPAGGQAATLSVKMVSVKDGRLLWAYDKTVGGPEAGQSTAETEIYFIDAPSPRLAGVELVIFGIGGLPVGTLLYAYGYPSASKATVLSGLAMVTAGALIIHAYPVFVGPDEVVCDVQGTTRNPFAPVSTASGRSVAAPASTSGSSYSVKSVGAAEVAADEDAELIRAVVADFVGELRAL